jgi:CRISPR-associated protein Cas1
MSEPLISQPSLPIRRLHNFVYCPRLFYFQWVENVFRENANTVTGSHLHRNVDQPSRWEDVSELGLEPGTKVRSLKMESEALGLIGVADLVESGTEGIRVVDYKKGSARRGENGDRIAKEADVMQVVAQALLLREQGIQATAGSIYYAEDKRHVPVELSEDAFNRCRTTIDEAKATAETGKCPPPLVDDPRCLYCSAYPVCLPNESAWWAHPQQDAPPGTALAPPQIKTAPRPDNDEGEVLVVQNPRAYVGQRGDQLVVTIQGETIQKKPIHQLRALYLYGAVQVSAQALQACLELGIDVSYFAPSGRFLGLTRGLPASGIDARRGQYRLFEQPAVRLQLARETIRAKIHNQRTMLMRNGDAGDPALVDLVSLRTQAGQARDLNVLLGIEGAAAALYFEHFRTMLKGANAWQFDFSGRNRRPPRDPVNALLSLGYSMLAKEITGVCHTVGLDPFVGFFHQPRYGRPALALDLMEEFRALTADSVAVSLLNRNELGTSDFIRSANGTFLSESGRKTFWQAWFRRLDTEVSHPEFGYKMSYRRMFEVQARQVWRFLRGDVAEYHAFTTR